MSGERRQPTLRPWPTPGPWVAQRNANADVPTLITSASRLIAQVWRARGATERGHSHGSIRALSLGELEANAHLIAAAPDLLAVVREYAEKIVEADYGSSDVRACCGAFYSYIDRAPNLHKDDCAAMAALAKAEGGTR